MHISLWLWYSAPTPVAWGIVGLLQKLSTNYVSAESSLIWLVVGFLVLEPLLYPGKVIFHYSATNVAFMGGSGRPAECFWRLGAVCGPQERRKSFDRGAADRALPLGCHRAGAIYPARIHYQVAVVGSGVRTDCGGVAISLRVEDA